MLPTKRASTHYHISLFTFHPPRTEERKRARFLAHVCVCPSWEVTFFLLCFVVFCFVRLSQKHCNYLISEPFYTLAQKFSFQFTRITTKWHFPEMLNNNIDRSTFKQFRISHSNEHYLLSLFTNHPNFIIFILVAAAGLLHCYSRACHTCNEIYSPSWIFFFF